MSSNTAIRIACNVVAVLLILFASWCLLWVVSSSTMAFTECAGGYDLFSENPRCRQPSIAGLLALASLLGAVATVLIGRRLRTRVRLPSQPADLKTEHPRRK